MSGTSPVVPGLSLGLDGGGGIVGLTGATPGLSGFVTFCLIDGLTAVNGGIPLESPFVSPFVNPLVSPFVSPFVRPFVRPFVKPFVRPLGPGLTGGGCESV